MIEPRRGQIQVRAGAFSNIEIPLYFLVGLNQNLIAKSLSAIVKALSAVSISGLYRGGNRETVIYGGCSAAYMYVIKGSYPG